MPAQKPTDMGLGNRLFSENWVGFRKVGALMSGANGRLVFGAGVAGILAGILEGSTADGGDRLLACLILESLKVEE